MGREKTSIYDPLTVRGAKQIIERAVKNKVSDIHIEPGEHFVVVRYRRGGLLYTANKLPKSTAIPLAIYLKNVAGLDPLQTQIPQIGQYNLRLDRNLYNLEVATLPVLDGEKITILLSHDKEISLNLKNLGLWGNNQLAVERSLTHSKGLILIASRQLNQSITTVATLLTRLQDASVKSAFVTSEIKSLPPNIKALTVQPKTVLSVARQIGLLLQDNFTVIGIDSIADKKTAQMIVEAAESKCLILSGVLATSASHAMVLLQRMYSSHTTAMVVKLVISQSFVTRLCPDCHESYEPSTVEHQQLISLFQLDRAENMQSIHKLEKAAAADGLEPDEGLSSTVKGINQLWKANLHGCKTCDYTGFTTDIGIFEVCTPSDHLRSLIISNKTISVIQKTAINDGMISLRVDALIKALRGLIDMPTLLGICSTAN